MWTGIALTVLYVVLIETLGFFLCTFLYLAAFMWVGRYRRPGVILATSLIGSLAFMFMFMKVVYVSLPLGAEPVRAGVVLADACDGHQIGSRVIEILQHLGGGFVSVFQPVNLLALFVGLVVGMLVAVLPGLTLVMGVVLALPFTYGMPITPAIILLTAMYISGTYGGAFTSILFRIPGEPLDVPLLWDGYAMAHKGQPAKALGWTLFAALTGGLVSTLAAVAMVHPFATFALKFDSPEYFAIILFGLTSIVALGGGSIINAFISLFLGLMIATRRRRRHLWRRALHLRRADARRRHRVPDRHGRRLRPGRGAGAAGDGISDAAARDGRQGRHRISDAARSLGHQADARAQFGPRHHHGHHSRAPGRRSPRSSPTASRRNTASAERSSAAASPKASSRRRPRRRRRSPATWCRC